MIFWKYFRPCVVLLISASTLCAQSVEIRGYLKDSESKESLIGATVLEVNEKRWAVTNNYGYFQLPLGTQGQHTLQVQSLGFSARQLTLNIQKDTLIIIELTPSNLYLDEVTVLGNNATKERISNNFHKVEVQAIKNLPVFFGEPDVVRTLQFLPGVHTGKEGTTGLYVRGGSPDQNLFLLDDIPLYNVYHMGGLFSVFDANAIKEMTLIKGAFPAKYGGRLSSVIDIRLKDGNKVRKKEILDVGLLSTRYSIEMPVKKEISSLLFSVRRCNLDLFSSLGSYMNSKGKFRAGYTFYDVNSKYHHRISPNSYLSISFYGGIDRLFIRQKGSEVTQYSDYTFKSKTTNDWKNIATAIKWSHNSQGGLFSIFSLGYSKFNYANRLKGEMIKKGNGETVQSSKSLFTSGLSDIIAKSDFEYTIENHTLSFGLGNTYHFYNPLQIEIEQNHTASSTGVSDFGSIKVKANEMDLYAQDEFSVGDIKVNAGIHTVAFIIQPKTFFSFQPRILLSREMTNTITVNSSWAKMSQFTHLLSNTGAGFPIDLWVPVTEKILPQHSWISTLGISYWLDRYSILIKSDFFYKRFRNLIDFKQGASFFNVQGQNWDDNVLGDGKGRAYGIEYFMEKKSGAFTGTLAYTWSRNERRFSLLNEGEFFPYRYDRPHDISLSGRYQLKNVVLTAGWFFHSGNAITLAEGTYPVYTFDQLSGSAYQIGFDYFPAQIYSSRNGYRMPSFHRLDLGINFVKEKKKFIRTFHVGIYNVYNRYNPFFLFFDQDNNGDTKLYKFSLFPFLPSFSWSLEFK